MFRSLITAASCGLLFVAASPVFAASPFDGTWKADVASAKLDQKPDVYTLKDGVYECSCVPPVKIAADGKPHMQSGHDYWDAMAVTVVDPQTVHIVTTKGGAQVGETTITISADGKTLNGVWTSSNNAKGMPIKDVYVEKRVAPGPAGAHAMSGSWVPVSDGSQMSDAALVSMIKVDGDVLSMSYPTGESFAATLGGPQVAEAGDKAGTMVSAVRIDADTLQKSEFRGGKLVSVVTLHVTGPTTIAMKSEDKKGGYVDEFTLNKQ